MMQDKSALQDLDSVLEADTPAPGIGHVIDFLPNGEVQAMHNDKFDLGILGPQKITRASEIMFDVDTQAWSIWMPKPYPYDNEFTLVASPSAQGIKTYDGARAVEVEWLNCCRLDGVEPLSDNGLSILEDVRNAFDSRQAPAQHRS